MKSLVALTVAIALFVAALTPARAQRSPIAVATFRLQVAGSIAPGTTFWVAYGPVNGHFGIVRLRGANGTYSAKERVPAGRTTVAYLAGHGTMKTRFGVAPGNPVVTIHRVESAVIGQGPLPTVRWIAPVG
jgi:hypothetical protein